MDELKYDFLADVQGRWQADLLKGFFEASGIEVQLFQESLGQHILPTTLDILGNVQIYVPKAQMSKARKLLKEYFNPPKAEKPAKAGIKKATPKKSDSKLSDSRVKTTRKPK